MKKAMYWVLIGIFSVIFIISAYVVVDYMIESKQSQDIWNDVKDDFWASYPEDTISTQPGITSPSSTAPTQSTATDPSVGDTTPTTPADSVPSNTVPQPTTPDVPGPDTTEPGATEPGYTEPEPTLPEPTPPEPTEPVHVHSYNPNVVAPTCTAGGYTLHTCECGDAYRDRETAATGHSYGPWKYGKYASSDVQRPRTRECVNCQTVLTQNTLTRFQGLVKANQDVVGYVYIEDTNINYPILHHPEEKDYYLQRNFYGNYDKHGCIYLRETCNIFEPTDVLTIYGHYMSDSTMFADLHKYRTKSFFNEHPYITMWDLYEEHTYQIVCLFKTSGTYGVGFPFHLYDNFANEAEYNEFIDGVRDLAIYDSGIETQYGDQFICLVTCEYTINNGRLILVAKRIS